MSAGIPIVSTGAVRHRSAPRCWCGAIRQEVHPTTIPAGVELQYAQEAVQYRGRQQYQTTQRNFLYGNLNYYTDLLTLNQQQKDGVPDHIDAMFQERYGYHFNRDKV